MQFADSYPEIAQALQELTQVGRSLTLSRSAYLQLGDRSGNLYEFTDGAKMSGEAATAELADCNSYGFTATFGASCQASDLEPFIPFLNRQCGIILALYKSYRDKQDIVDLFFQSESQLKELMVLQNAILSGAGYAIIAADHAGSITVFNTAAAELTGYTPSEAESSASIVQLPFLAHDGGLFPEGEQEEFFTRRDGGVIPVLVYRTTLYQADGKEQGKLLIASDITRRTVAEEKQKQLMAELEEINGQLSDFAHVVSHDLKAPLRGIASLAQWLAEDYADRLDAEGQKHLAQLQKRVQKMGKLIDGILHYSRISRSHEAATAVNIRSVIHEALELASVPKTFTVVIKGEFPVVHAERTKLLQVFQNLISNSVKYNDKENGEISVFYTKSGTDHQFSIRDNGPGIPQDKSEQVFQLFKRLAQNDASGTGIGLSVVKKIVEGYGGRAWYNANYHGGAEFCFSLPVASVTPASAS